ncbi:MAG: hypothetical protein NTU66_05555 [Elusimicrobia bacterium]|nr:hypothetical protein [Elusimicrobiota bacterium]
MLKRYPLAVMSLIIGLLSFVHLFGLEKAVLAVIAGKLALDDATQNTGKPRTMAVIGLTLGIAYIIILAAIAVTKGLKGV